MVLLLQVISLHRKRESQLLPKKKLKSLHEALEFITDRLAIRQAMLGVSLDINQDSAEGSSLDEVQQFWLLVEKSCVALIS